MGSNRSFAVATFRKRDERLDSDERRQFEQIMLPHLDAVFNLARWLIQDEHAAEDVAQEAFVRAARYFDSFRGGDGRAWLLSIVRRASFDWLAKRKAQPLETFDEEIHNFDDSAADPQILAMRSFEQARVRQALEELPLPLREVLVLRELEGLSYQQVAAVAEIPIGTAMSRISRGRQQLQRRLASTEQSEAI
jgi:RNA polymerase sigma factor (sigma-70 family)